MDFLIDQHLQEWEQVNAGPPPPPSYSYDELVAIYQSIQWEFIGETHGQFWPCVVVAVAPHHLMSQAAALTG